MSDNSDNRPAATGAGAQAGNQPLKAKAMEDFLKNKVPEVFTYNVFPVNPKQYAKQYNKFLHEATERLIEEVRTFLSSQGVR